MAEYTDKPEEGHRDPPTSAVGISYDQERGGSPVISAIGDGQRAEAICDMAKELGIYIHRDEQLLEELKSLREGESVPKQLYGVIATIIAFSYLLQGKTPEYWTREDGSRAVNVDA
ncbi:MAG: EscU/YscU/HrcU family type III secretion system export apparatus switch protein [Succinivibrionaceae bacterium]|nr:EscU/YscU/HrcU family type III secretion system export apparatus switch protein [Succinivibrionaceae bacterium]